ncbi:MAG: hypothetical protein ACTJHU_00235 [Mycetocola sp.]
MELRLEHAFYGWVAGMVVGLGVAVLIACHLLVFYGRAEILCTETRVEVTRPGILGAVSRKKNLIRLQPGDWVEVEEGDAAVLWGVPGQLPQVQVIGSDYAWQLSRSLLLTSRDIKTLNQRLYAMYGAPHMAQYDNLGGAPISH